MTAIELVETLDGTPDDVWPIVSDPEMLREWLDDDVELTLRVGAPIRTRGHVGVVDELEIGRRLSFTWAPVAPGGGPVTTVEFEIEADPDGEHTVLRIRECVVDVHLDIASIAGGGGFLALREPDGAPHRLDAVFSALGDPTRRGLFESLAASPATASELAERAPITRQAITKHLGVLEAAALVESERDGRRVVYHATPSTLSEASAWMEHASAAWNQRVARLRRAHARRRQ